ncbi:MAG TPA: hypothetical protein VKU38_03455, partial [Ktedonobacteraceae bacterium]|nr:hypothetical protein [Ktedonobacteraceae bacterium]
MVLSSGKRYGVATHYTLLEQVKNRLALGLLLVFVPLWYWFGYLFTTNDPIGFRFRATNTFLQVSSLHITLLTLGLNAITLIVGFMFFAATRKNMRFDHRLVLSGYPQLQLILARLTALLVVSCLIALYACAILLIFWRPVVLPVVWLSFFLGTLIYGGLGILLGVLVRGELEGFFVIIMVSLIDTFIQNPIGNPAANKDFVMGFPAFAPTQLAVAGGFTHVMPWLYILISLAWLVSFTL